MTSLERKQKTENLLKSLSIPFIEHLPTIEEEHEARLRTPQDIAARALILTYLNYTAEEEDEKPTVVDFLKKEGLWDQVSDHEKSQFATPQLTKQEKINISWRSEAILVLLWALKKVDELDVPVAQVSIADLLEKLPAFMSSTDEFIQSATTRAVSEILDASDLIYRLHWAARNKELNNLASLDLDLSIIQERHLAINWVTVYEDANWDDVTTDT